MTTGEALQRDALVLQTRSAEALAIVEKRPNAWESNHSAIEPTLSALQRDVLCRHSGREPANRAECELTQLVNDQSVLRRRQL
jgi:hypothetical protein